MRDLVDLGQSSSSVNTTVLRQSSETEENHNAEARNAEKVKMEELRRSGNTFSPVLRSRREEAIERKMEDRWLKQHILHLFLSGSGLLCCVGRGSRGEQEIT